MIKYENYSIVIITYKPSNSLYDLINMIYTKQDFNIFVVDSSPELEFSEMKGRIDAITSNDVKKTNLRCFHINNKGAAYSINYGIEKCIEYGKDLFTIMDDDTSIIPQNFNRNEIVDYFNTHLDLERDILILADGEQRENIDSWVESGITLSKQLFHKIKFREEFIMDQIDIEFCKLVKRANGKIEIFPKKILFNKPVGSDSVRGTNILPYWRIYTLMRNVIVMWKEKKISSRDVSFDILLFVKALIFGKKKLMYLNAFLNGIIDGVNLNQSFEIVYIF